MPSKPNQISRDALALAVASGLSAAAAARSVGISPRTAQKWALEPGFIEAVARLRRKALDRACGLLSEGTVRSAATLLTLQGKEYPAEIRLKAATSQLEAALKVRAQTDVDERLAALEATHDDE